MRVHRIKNIFKRMFITLCWLLFLVYFHFILCLIVNILMVSAISKMSHLKENIWGKSVFINKIELSTSLFSPEKSNVIVSSQCLLCGKEVKRGEKKQAFLDTGWANLVRNAERWSKINIKESHRLFHFRHVYSEMLSRRMRLDR